MPGRRGFVEQVARIETEARKLAWSGQNRSSSSIEIALISQGYRKARSLRQPVDTMPVGSPL